MTQPQSNKNPGFLARLRYKIDQQFSMHPGILIAWLGLLSVLVMLLIAFILYLTGMAPGSEPPYNFVEALWVGFLQTMGSGSVGERGTVWPYRFMMLGVMLFNLFLFSIVIGSLTSGMQNRLEELRRGRSQVIERNHTVILGWSEQIFTVVAELVRARASEPNGCIVVLGERDKSEMEDDIRQKVGDTGRVRIVCRTGSPLEMTNLDRVSLNTSRNIIVLPPEGSHPDAQTIKVVLAILNNPNRRAEPYRIVATVRNPRNVDLARVLGKDEVEWILQGDVISRIIAQTALQPGLSVVYTELFDYSGNEIYLPAVPTLAGKTFGEALHASETVTVIGQRAKGQKPRLEVPLETVIQPGDQLVVIAQDDSSISFDPTVQPLIHNNFVRSVPQPNLFHENTLILGWNNRGAGIVRELDRYAAPGSVVKVAANPQLSSEDIAAVCQEMENLSAIFEPGDTCGRPLLESLELEKYHHVVLLAYSENLDIQQADSLTAITLLHIRDLAELGGYKFSIVTEMLDLRNSKLVASNRPDDFIVSDRLISLLMAQVAETRGMCAVYDEIFDPQGVEIYLKPASLYVPAGAQTNFHTLIEAARLRQEIAIGYRYASATERGETIYKLSINPSKSSPISLGSEDQLIVLAKH
jgi:voltage-gated potassium channel Kch